MGGWWPSGTWCPWGVHGGLHSPGDMVAWGQHFGLGDMMAWGQFSGLEALGDIKPLGTVWWLRSPWG